MKVRNDVAKWLEEIVSFLTPFSLSLARCHLFLDVNEYTRWYALAKLEIDLAYAFLTLITPKRKVPKICSVPNERTFAATFPRYVSAVFWVTNWRVPLPYSPRT